MVKALGAAVIIMAVVAMAAAVDSRADAPSPGSAPVRPIVLIDVNHIIDHSRHFEQLADGLKREMQLAGEQLQREGEFGNMLYEKLKDFSPGSPDYKNLEQDVVQRRADFELRWSRRYEDFAQRKSKLLYAAFAEAQAEARQLAERSGAHLVLQFDSQPIEPGNSESVMRRLDGIVIYQRGLDVTPIVLEAINARAPGPGVVGQSTTLPPASASNARAVPTGSGAGQAANVPPGSSTPVRTAQGGSFPNGASPGARPYGAPANGARRGDGTSEPTVGSRLNLSR